MLGTLTVDEIELVICLFLIDEEDFGVWFISVLDKLDTSGKTSE